jgi:hypothetical protein
MVDDPPAPKGTFDDGRTSPLAMGAAANDSRVASVQRTARGLDVSWDADPDGDSSDVPPRDDELVRAMAAALMSWPRLDVSALRTDAPVPGLAGAVETLIALRVFGGPADNLTTTVRFARLTSKGSVAAFTVQVSAERSDSGMCHHVDMDARLAGELSLSAREGALLSLRLRGPIRDFEGTCSEAPRPETLCNQGEATYEIAVDCPERGAPGRCDLR